MSSNQDIKGIVTWGSAAAKSQRFWWLEIKLLLYVNVLKQNKNGISTSYEQLLSCVGQGAVVLGR
jgi:hypothetical protein